MINISNIFGHLDALVFDSTTDEITKGEVNRDLQTAGIQGVQHNEVAGVNTERVGNFETDIRNIALRPGTKILLKAGYDNNPDNLKTIFAGQITEMTTGEIMTIVCQDWASELLGIWDAENSESPYDKIGIFRLNDTVVYDQTATGTSRAMIQEMLRHLNCRHLGAWQIGSANAGSGIHSFSWQQRPITNLRNQQGEAIGADRSGENIRPGQMPLVSVWGYDALTKDVKYKNRVMWEILNDLRLYHSNNIFFVRPYGWGDGTLYFGPPWGTYNVEDTRQVGNKLITSKMNELRFEAFKRIINSNSTISVNGLKEVDGEYGFSSRRARSEILERFVQDTAAWIMQFLNIDTRKANGAIPVGPLLSSPNFAALLLSNQSSDVKEEFKNTVKANLFYGPTFSWLWIKDNANDGEHILRPGSSEETLKIYYKLLNNTTYIGVEEETAIIADERYRKATEFILREINQLITNTANGLAIDEYNANPQNRELKSLVEYIEKTDIPVRRWHVVNSTNHIVSNQITLDTSFYNCIQIDDVHGTLKFDPGLHEERTRFYPEFAEYHKVMKGFISMSLLGDQLKRMYRGEIILIGNPSIRPHDLLVIIDNVREMYGVVEVDKVVHSMNLENGFISVVTPALLTEVGDSTFSHAYQAFYTALIRDTISLENKENPLLNALTTWQGFLNPDLIKNWKTLPIDSDGDFNTSGKYAIAGSVFGLQTREILGKLENINTIPGLQVLSGLRYYFTAIQNTNLKEHVKTHPITITPLIKRGWPWLGGIDGAGEHTAVLQNGFDLIKTWSDIRTALNYLYKAKVGLGETYKTGENLYQSITGTEFADGQPKLKFDEPDIVTGLGDVIDNNNNPNTNRTE